LQKVMGETSPPGFDYIMGVALRSSFPVMP
jgi:hypothetical protein